MEHATAHSWDWDLLTKGRIFFKLEKENKTIVKNASSMAEQISPQTRLFINI